MPDREEVPFKEKIKSIGFVNKQGTTRKRDVINEDNGKKAGYQIDHWDGRVDAVANGPQTIHHKVKGTVHD